MGGPDDARAQKEAARRAARNRYDDDEDDGGGEPMDGDVPDDDVPSPPPPPPQLSDGPPPSRAATGTSGAAAGPEAAAAALKALDPVVSDAGGEVSMSVEETNRVRAALGLKPLRMGPPGAASDAQAEHARHVAARAAEEQAAAGAALAARVAEMKQRRELDARFRVKGLGEADDEDAGGMAAWVQKSRRIEEQRKAEAAHKAAEMARKFAEQDAAARGSDDDEGSDDDRPGAYSARDLAGLTVRHSAADLAIGESVVLTLADAGVLDDAEDALENVRMAQHRDAARAKEAAKPKAKPMSVDDDGMPRKMLDKYDEQDGLPTLRLGDDGVVDPKAVQEAEGLAKREQLGLLFGRREESLASTGLDGAGGGFKVASDYMSKEEAAAFLKPKAGAKKKKLRRKEPAAGEGGAGGGGTASLVAELEAAAAAEAAARSDGGGGGGGGDYGSREARAAQMAAARREQLAGRDQAYDHAMAKAAEASKRLLVETPADEPTEEDDDADRELMEALARSRRQAAAAGTRGGGAAALGEAMASARAAEEAGGGPADGVGSAGAASGAVMLFTEMEEFCRSIDTTKAAALAPDADEAGGAGGGGGADVDQLLASALTGAAVEMETDAKPEPADEDEEGPGVDPRAAARAAAAASEAGVLGGGSRLGSGLAGALAALRSKGALGEAMTHAGRTNDIKAEKHMWEAYAKGTPFHQKDHALPDSERSFDVRLDRFDEFGRLQTPKEQFRAFCHRFHGIMPSKNKKDKRMKQFLEEQKTLAMREGDTPLGAMERVRAVQAQAHTPFVVLAGNIKPGQMSDASSGFAMAEKDDGGAPAAGAAGGAGASRAGGGAGGSGGLAASALGTLGTAAGGRPLLGDKKVEFMLGIKRPRPEGRMPPPPPKQPKPPGQ